jgi:TorA maturation chaperone TorD
MSDREEEQGVESEEQARALWYAVLSRLFYAAPDRALLDGLAAEAPSDPEAERSPFLESWTKLQAACRGADPDALREEFESLFIGVGKAPVTPYTSSYAASHAPDRHLLSLRNTLQAWGLIRAEQVFEAEDHVSALFDSMRWLIEQRRPLEDQRAFFDAFVDTALPLFCDAINSSPAANFYRRAGEFARAFVAIEKDAFDMHTAV